MKKIVLPRRALFLWQLRAVLVTFLAAFLLTLLLSDFLFWYRLSLILIGLAFFSFSVFTTRLSGSNFPFFAKRTVSRRLRCILQPAPDHPIDNIQYVTTLRTPDMLPFSLSSVMIHSVGTSLYLPCLSLADAQNLQEYCVRRKSADKEELFCQSIAPTLLRCSR